ncbi:unnamed protein product (macronuclear) [Paramecium tetraurelia]|uniref:Tetratricopeptide repeat protein n=1 Tax=Paramecium tetraurelia TaxID=5888 RepID=A0DE86_PARTE|nr:uncharacterized protein GSPATT00016195001 [Paramecium tetraurelia]CAK81353.1 unnamed protein product [Paramecium tetraurelia]|eukprot:XP_001448750.1 hypothetical protein (macronuclear) [Paramecium tetraurelia strain d4-2]
MQEWNDKDLVYEVQKMMLIDVQEQEKSIEVTSSPQKKESKSCYISPLKVQALVRKGRLEKAQQCWDEWLQNCSDKKDQKNLYYSKSQFLKIARWDSKLIEIIEEGIKNSSDKIFYLEEKGNYLQQNKKFEEAVQFCKECIKLFPIYYQQQKRQNNQEETTKQLNAGMKEFQIIPITGMYIFITQKKRRLYVNRKDIKRQLKVGMKESEIINTLSDFTITKVFYLGNLAKLLSYLGKFDELIECWDNGIQSNGEYIDYYREKVRALSILKRSNEIIQCWELGIQNNKKMIIYYENKGLDSYKNQQKYQPNKAKFKKLFYAGIMELTTIRIISSFIKKKLKCQKDTAHSKKLQIVGIQEFHIIEIIQISMNKNVSSKIQSYLQPKLQKVKGIGMKCLSFGIKELNGIKLLFNFMKKKVKFNKNYLVRILQQNGQISEINKCINKGIELNQNKPQFYQLKASILIKQRLWEEAIYVWDQGIQINRDSYEFYHEKSILLFKIRQMSRKVRKILRSIIMFKRWKHTQYQQLIILFFIKQQDRILIVNILTKQKEWLQSIMKCDQANQVFQAKTLLFQDKKILSLKSLNLLKKTIQFYRLGDNKFARLMFYQQL